MHLLIYIFFAATVLWLFYWAVVRQSIIDTVQDDLANLKNQVSWNIINGEDGYRSKSAQLLLDEVNANDFVGWLSFTQIALHLFKNRAQIKAEAAKEMAFFESSPKWIRDARTTNARLTIKAALANSPIWWLPLPVILLCGIFSKKALDWWSDAESSASQLRTDHFGTIQPI